METLTAFLPEEFANSGSLYEGASGHTISIFNILISFFGIFLLWLMVFGLLSIILWILAISDALKRSREDFNKTKNGGKDLWLVLLIISIFMGLHFVVSVIYYFLIYRKDKKTKISKKRNN